MTYKKEKTQQEHGTSSLRYLQDLQRCDISQRQRNRTREAVVVKPAILAKTFKKEKIMSSLKLI